MENGPKLPHERQGGENATVEMVHELVAENKLREALLAAAMRIEMLQGVCDDTDDAIAKQEGEISPEEWGAEKSLMQQEISELQEIIQSIETDTQND